jgi:hypothetical protein
MSVMSALKGTVSVFSFPITRGRARKRGNYQEKEAKVSSSLVETAVERGEYGTLIKKFPHMKGN